MDLASARDIKLLDLTDARRDEKINPGYTLVTVPKGTYPKQDKDVKVIGYSTHIVAVLQAAGGHRLHDDQAPWLESKASMPRVVKDMAKLTPRHGRGHRRAFHPGAAKFYKEAGSR